jgi:hypothetical protein
VLRILDGLDVPAGRALVDASVRGRNQRPANYSWQFL